MITDQIYVAETDSGAGEAHLLEGKQAVEYILAGRGVITVLNTETGNRFTFSFGRPADAENGSGPVFVTVMYKNDQALGVSGYLGAIWERSRFVAAGKAGSQRRRDTEFYLAEELKAWGWIWDRLTSGRLPASFEIWHSGQCGRCGRMLTDPESIARGLGPDCAEAIGAIKASRKDRAGELLDELGF